ncbi:hypothetical protein ACQJBY_026543 [Aegilops geniculata]
MASSSPPSWIILGSVARVSGTDAAAEDIPPGADPALALAAPPRVTLLTVPLRVSPGPDEYPMVLAVDPSGLLLLSTPPAPSPPPSPPSSPDADGFVTLNITDRTPPGYYVCDASSSAAARLPGNGRGFLDDRSVGLLASPAGGGHYMVVELQPLIGSDEATLLCFSSVTGRWKEKDVFYPMRYGIWNTDAAITNAGKLCWVDLSCGILSCDPFAKKPVLDFVELPEGRLRQNIHCLHCAGRELSTRRCVQVSAGMFRLVELTCGDHSSRPRGVVLASWMRLQQAQSRSHRKAPRVVMWTLADQDTGEWKVEHRVNLADVWADESYKATGLPKKTPVLALVHPKNPDVVYFFLGKHLLGVNLRTRKVVECEVYELVGPSRKHVSSRCVHPWELPATLCAGIPSETGSGVNEGFASVASNERGRD